ncbi:MULTISPECIES: TetR/AcrR family transcriptional regulator [unclassified Streptomyces]|uniref:TetR/AcrR family transcriptional regulator n=1 Tax=unclassified Streptomyces TaxID=2593676 RepID=UPI000DB9E22B|nr:TetR/AcrR family transcriptional regulator [Streptomyces sp. PsTaAH-137]MYT69088.1 TetR family transcriptional regulator [Streptomyces sp. SID8367]RAJ82599.1 TetR family transcriptional regulator [Streptomyces sp. PsTaAH-137]
MSTARNSARSREALLAAATTLFSERGYDRTTIREIGERAGVDPSLIARYFGSKPLLYVEVLRAEHGDDRPDDLLTEPRLREVARRAQRRGPVPLLRVAVEPLSDKAAQEATRAALHDRLVEPLRDRFTREGRDRPGLRADILVAAVSGVLLARHSGAFDELAEAEVDEVVDILLETFDADGSTGTG